jgi:hypothetical protein
VEIFRCVCRNTADSKGHEIYIYIEMGQRVKQRLEQKKETLNDKSRAGEDVSDGWREEEKERLPGERANFIAETGRRSLSAHVPLHSV